MPHKGEYKTPAGKKVPKGIRGTRAGHMMTEKRMKKMRK